jgi:hypothetical protein
VRELERQLEDSGALLEQPDAQGTGELYGNSVVSGGGLSSARQSMGGENPPNSARSAGHLTAEQIMEARPDLAAKQDRVDKVRSMVHELESQTIPMLLQDRSDLLNTGAAMDIRLMHVTEQSVWEAMAGARWDGVDISNQEYHQRLRFQGGVEALRRGPPPGKKRKGGRLPPFRAFVDGASGIPPTDEEFEDELADRLHRSRFGSGGSVFGASTFRGGTTGRSGVRGERGGGQGSSDEEDGLDYGDDDEDDGPERRAKRRAAREAAEALMENNQGVKRLHTWQIFLPSDIDGSVARAAMAFREWDRVRLFVPANQGPKRRRNRLTEFDEDEERELRDPLATHRRRLSERLRATGLEEGEVRLQSFAYYQKRGETKNEDDDDFSAGMPSEIPASAAVMGGQEDDGSGSAAMGLSMGAATSRSGFDTGRSGGVQQSASLEGMREVFMRDVNLVRVRHGRGVCKDDETGGVFSGRYVFVHHWAHASSLAGSQVLHGPPVGARGRRRRRRDIRWSVSLRDSLGPRISAVPFGRPL